MDRSQDVLAALSSAVFATLRAATAPAHSRRDEESDGLHGMLSNPDFIPPPLRDDDEVRNHPAAVYDDLPPLEDDVALPSEVDLPNQDDDQPPPLEADDSSSIVTSPQSGFAPADAAATSSSSNASTAASSGITSSVRFTSSNNPLPTSVQPSVSHGVLATPSTSGRATSRSATGTVNAEDDGAESDSSLPSLQSVSDSSSDEEDDMSENGSEWDDDESLDDSEGDPDIARLVEEADRVSSGAPYNPTGPIPATGVGVTPETPTMFRNTLQSYRELLERARVLIPDIDVRLGPPPDWVVDITNRIAGAGVDNYFDRAEILIKGMEVIPDELVLRYEKLRSTDGEDVDGCAICRDNLVDKSPDALEAWRVLAIFTLLPFSFERDTSVAFPFDIDPHSLTLRISRGLHDLVPTASEADPPRVWQPPQVESMRDWLAAEEKAKQTSVPRVRPHVVMPEYPAMSPPTAASLSEMLGVPAWGTDPETGGFDMTIAYRDIQDLREHLLDMEARRRATGLPTRPPSAPPVTTSDAPPIPLPEGVFLGGGAHSRPRARDSEYERLRQQIAIDQHGEHVVPFHNFPASLMEHVVNLTSTPVSRGPPPNSVDVDVFTHVGHRPDDLGSLDMYSQVLRDFQNMRRSANHSQHLPPPPIPVTPVATAQPQNNVAQMGTTPTASASLNTPHSVPGAQEGTSDSSSSTASGDGVPPSSGHNPMEELD
ncbi:hypothetical protein LXA43DRAFT_1062338 [Ganoderma leucocontextum]|nr:hypothetical protein LXA43DRAFT_1062338 [Ganoderma leucocontextum]